MTVNNSPTRFPSFPDSAAILLRWILGLEFIYMGWQKVVHPVGFLKLVLQYDLVSSSFLLNTIASALPWFEIFCGLLLLAGIAVRGSAVMLLAMLIPFTIVVLRRALEIKSAKAIAFCAVKFDCGCGNGEVVICHKLVENCLLILFSAWLLYGRGRQLAARYSLFTNAQERPRLL